MKTFGIFLTTVSILILGLDIYYGIVSNYRYNRDFASYWNLADKASTIVKKIEGIDKFINTLENSGLKGKYNALWMNTLDNSFDKNLEALKSLQIRLHEIREMDLTSFQYNTAIEQITRQEQGEAGEILSVFRGIWGKTYYPLIWDWIGLVQVSIVMILFFIGMYIWIYNIY